MSLLTLFWTNSSLWLPCSWLSLEVIRSGPPPPYRCFLWFVRDEPVIWPIGNCEGMYLDTCVFRPSRESLAASYLENCYFLFWLEEG